MVKRFLIIAKWVFTVEPPCFCLWPRGGFRSYLNAICPTSAGQDVSSLPFRRRQFVPTISSWVHFVGSHFVTSSQRRQSFRRGHTSSPAISLRRHFVAFRFVVGTLTEVGFDKFLCLKRDLLMCISWQLSHTCPLYAISPASVALSKISCRYMYIYELNEYYVIIYVPNECYAIMQKS